MVLAQVLGAGEQLTSKKAANISKHLRADEISLPFDIFPANSFKGEVNMRSVLSLSLIHI